MQRRTATRVDGCVSVIYAHATGQSFRVCSQVMIAFCCVVTAKSADVASRRAPASLASSLSCRGEPVCDGRTCTSPAGPRSLILSVLLIFVL
ncbi:hypothetical protein PsYK624_142450 [Phanerochaete sordida]|uniref:Uncharacterized protein n=1 Tax=Phanerochaete sordida TaxID=48140 RepID=A0A9P3LK16_9APHY|nr:hypothetical protein PsYK624_142450 [Phanerochaete sordida]